MPRKHYTSSPNPGAGSLNPRHDCFLLKSDHRKEVMARDQFNGVLQMRVGYGLLPLAPTVTGCNW